MNIYTSVFLRPLVRTMACCHSETINKELFYESKKGHIKCWNSVAVSFDTTAALRVAFKTRLKLSSSTVLIIPLSRAIHTVDLAAIGETALMQGFWPDDEAPANTRWAVGWCFKPEAGVLPTVCANNMYQLWIKEHAARVILPMWSNALKNY